MAAGRGLVAFGILGPFEVWQEDVPLRVPGAKPQALLVLLLLSANEWVANDRLIDDLWDGAPPAGAPASLHAHVSKVRRLFKSGTGVEILSRRGAYQLRVDPSAIDARRFEDLAAEGRRFLDREELEAAAESYSVALDLWRGSALEGVELSVAAAEARRLEEERVSALEALMEARLGTARHPGDLVPELEALVREHPFRERGTELLMVALYRSGRQAEALEAYRAARDRLRDELGLEPGPTLRRLERSILAHEESLGPASEIATARSLPRRSRRNLLVLATLIAGGAAVVGSLTLGSRGGASARTRVAPNSLVAIDPHTNRPVLDLPTGHHPDALALGGRYLWVSNVVDRTVSRVDLVTHAVRTFGGFPFAGGLAVDNTGAVWVSGFGDPRIARLAPGSFNTADMQTIRVPSRAEALAVGGGYLWVTNPSRVRGAGGDTVSQIGLSTRRFVRAIPVDLTPIDVVFADGQAWVADYDGSTLSIVRAGSSASHQISLEGGPVALAAGGGFVWAVSYWNEVVYRIDPATGRVTGHGRLPSGSEPYGVRYAFGSVWVGLRGLGGVERLNPRTLHPIARVPVPGTMPCHLIAAHGLLWASLQPTGDIGNC